MEADVAIVGAGSAGSAAALLAAERGLSVVVVEQRSLGRAGARWLNEVPRWAFEESGIAPPAAGGVFADGPYHLLAGHGLARVTVREPRTMTVDMRTLVARLQRHAEHAGARFVDRVRVLRVEPHALLTTAGAIRAGVVVDASGSPADAETLCVAAQAVHAVTDRHAARAWLAAHGAEEGDTVAFGAVHGGYSVLSARVASDRVALLAGAIPADGQPVGRAMLRRFVTEHAAWVGDVRFGGASAVPLGAPPRRMVEGSIARLGDAAGQVFPAHASGVGVGLVAARLLVDAIVDALADRGRLVAYERAVHARFGRLFAYYQRLSGVVRRLRAEDVAALMDAGVLDEESVAAALEQRLPTGSAGRVARAVRAPRALLSVALSVAGGNGGNGTRRGRPSPALRRGSA